MTVLLENRQSIIAVDRDVHRLTNRVIEAAVTKEGFPHDFEIGVILVDNITIAALNKEYRNIDAATDVLSFAMMEGEEFLDFNENDEVMMGDVVISMEKMAQQAEEYGHSREREFAYLLLHGVLHILGHTHDKKEDRQRMREREEEILQHLGLIQG